MLYADLTIFFVNVVQIVAHFHIKYREKVYIFWGDYNLLKKILTLRKLYKKLRGVALSKTFHRNVLEI